MKATLFPAPDVQRYLGSLGRPVPLKDADEIIATCVPCGMQVIDYTRAARVQ